jgi:hypothetical protein
LEYGTTALASTRHFFLRDTLEGEAILIRAERDREKELPASNARGKNE